MEILRIADPVVDTPEGHDVHKVAPAAAYKPDEQILHPVAFIVPEPMIVPA
jgi:hypothetical protein